MDGLVVYVLKVVMFEMDGLHLFQTFTDIDATQSERAGNGHGRKNVETRRVGLYQGARSAYSNNVLATIDCPVRR